MRLLIVLFSALILTTFSNSLLAQRVVKTDSVPKTHADSLKLKLKADSIANSKQKLKAKVEYEAVDSISFDFTDKKAFLFKDGSIKYQKMAIKAASIEIDFNKSITYSKGVADSTGKMTGEPVFKDGEQEFETKTLNYNYDTKKGVISDVVTKEGEGFIHGKQVKKMADDVTNIKNGSYTTCDLPHPHFELRFTKAKVIPNKETITGPAYMVLEDVPLPIALPFGFFPNKNGRMSGILMPSPGESANRGFYLRDFGYYWGINDNLDFQIKGEAYTRGSWAANPSFNYFRRYKYQGSFDLRFATNITGEKGSTDYSKSKDFSITWMHTQDAKANPVNRFSANVNIQTSKFNRFNPTTVGNYLSNTFQSSISFQTSIDDRIFISASARHSQNTLTKQMSVTLPDLAISANRWYPFKKEEGGGQRRWYEDISLGYSMTATNQLDTYDSLLFKPGSLKKLRNGIQHSIPISSTFKILKYITVSNAVNLTEDWYLQSISKQWLKTKYTVKGKTRDTAYLAIDTVQGFKAAHDFSYSTSFNTTVYGIVRFKKGPIRAIRHVFAPSVSYNFKPDFSDPKWGYYKSYVDSNGVKQKYSIFEGSTYGGPSAAKAGSINISIRNNLEMKVPSKKDTVTGLRTIKLIDQLTISTNYNLAADSLRWSPVTMSGSTPILKNTNINFSATWDPYSWDARNNRRSNILEWDYDRKLLRFEDANWSFGLSHTFTSKSGKQKVAATNAAL
ncbi:MAG: putative LPS assembly protein LptD, partial [Bacteroidota bacterium]|nr:putative LPS assembly protein LptD [Bacteroidota bacterium]